MLQHRVKLELLDCIKIDFIKMRKIVLGILLLLSGGLFAQRNIPDGDLTGQVMYSIDGFNLGWESVVGTTGSTGSTGVVGVTGSTSNTGSSGSTGSTSNTGVTGNTGSTPIPGQMGATGRTSNQGAQA